MARSLVIVESPAKAKTINKYLGKNYVVRSSIGHVRDLQGAPAADHKDRAKEAAKTRAMSPAKKAAYKKKRDRTQLIRRMGVNPDKGWAANYGIVSGKEKRSKSFASLPRTLTRSISRRTLIAREKPLPGTFRS